MSQTSTRRTLFDRPITPETLPELFAHHRRQFGGWGMTAGTTEPEPQDGAGAQGGDTAPQRPEGVSEDEWTALGDPGRRAIVRERERATAAERALAAAKARPAPPKNDQGGNQNQNGAGGDGKGTQQQNGGGDGGGNQPDIAKLIADAVNAAVKPLMERDEQREAADAIDKITTEVLTRAKGKLHDETDAITNIDLTQVTDGNGRPDPTKIDEQIKDLLARKPHLGKPVDDRRFAPPGAGASAGGSNQPLEQRVQATLAQMQASVGMTPTTANS